MFAVKTILFVLKIFICSSVLQEPPVITVNRNTPPPPPSSQPTSQPFAAGLGLWVLGTYGQSCDLACESFDSSAKCSADNIGLFAWPLSEEQLRTIRSIGVFDVVSQVFLSGDGLCSEIFEDSSGMFLDDPSIHEDNCYYGVQRYADRGYCSAVGSGRRFCPCLNSVQGVVPPTEQPTVLSLSPSIAPSTDMPTTLAPTSAAPTPVQRPIPTPSSQPITARKTTRTLSNKVITANTPLQVPYYSTSLTASATINAVPYTFTACFAGFIHIADCDPVRCLGGSNDQYIRLYVNGIQVASNDDSCSLCSVIDYLTVSSTCQTYTLQQGCFGSSQCSGNFTISLMNSPTIQPISLRQPTPSPTRIPTLSPAIQPSTQTGAPSANISDNYYYGNISLSPAIQPSTKTSVPSANISENYYYGNISGASPSPSRAMTRLPIGPKTWVLGAHGRSCDSTCASFDSSSKCSADSTGLFA
eukprot:gene25136-33654_t